jgi:hypothetical protein
MAEQLPVYLRRRALLLTCLLLGSCVGTSSGVTGNDPGTGSAGQSETAATTSFSGGVSRIVVTFNDETGTGNTIQYGTTSRTVLNGTSLMGWAYSDNGGTSWQYGGKLAPPAGWSVLWGDPAITTSGANYNLAFLSNLAVPASKYPSGGIQGYFYYGDGRSSYIGGACIAKSTDGGAHFSIYQCVSNTQPIVGIPDTPQGHFYDGGSMASSPSGDIFAAYNDVAASQIDVWRAANENASFQPLPPPFPNMVVATHPRLRVGPDGTLYVAAMVLTGSRQYLVYLNRYAGGAWAAPIQASNPGVSYPSIDLGSVVLGAPLTVRVGPQFSFDIGAASDQGADAIRMLYTRQDDPENNSPFYIDASACAADLQNCHAVSGWKIGPSAPNETRLDLFNPNVVAWRGFFGLPPSWQGSFVERYGGSVTTTNVARMTLGYVNGNPFTIPVDILKNNPMCSDTRGYLGDYDDMILTGFQDSSGLYTRFYTNSSAGCTLRWEFEAQQQHVGAVQYSY